MREVFFLFKEVVAMPKEFTACVKAGGKVRTKKLKDGKTQKICYLNGKRVLGYVEKKKTSHYRED